VRVIGGSAGGRKLTAPKGDRVRPTSDRVKEALFSILLSRLGSLTGLTVLDLFAGTGNLGIEALSRGAARALFVDNHPQSREMICSNLTLTGFTDRAEVLPMDVPKALQRLATVGNVFDLIFIDPPYQEVELMHRVLGMLAEQRLTTVDTLIVFETGSKTVLTLPERLELMEKRIYGDTAISLIVPVVEQPY
jgi:16S rRNA (guanine(966)-N(2))-methyltransferase RsmD